MNLLTTIVSIVSTIVIAGCGIATARLCARNAKEPDASRKTKVNKVMRSIISCNNYPKLMDVFDQLSANEKKYRICENDRFRGYFKDE